ncbi:MAG TPA: Crp/Fnr family transcriptional regulator [Hyphomicrobiaceae bacterium]|nr:Crp/Fnr family transcriptional regulator [Hyphomicrobiaceae bacterium]
MIMIMCNLLPSIFEAGRDLGLKRDQVLFATNDRVVTMFLVVTGAIVLQRHTSSGTAMTLQRATPGTIIAEASAYARHYHCDAVATTESRVRAIPVETFRKTVSRDPALSEIWSAYLARSVQSARLRSEIRTLRTVSERLDAWLGAAGNLPARGTWQHLAAELGVTREALYRELARRRSTADRATTRRSS